MTTSKRYKIVLFTRFLGYFIFLTGLLSTLAVFSPILGAEFNYRFDRFKGTERTVALPNPSPNPGPNGQNSPTTSGGFGEINASTDIITPVSTDFAIVIEKINANAKVISVNPADEKAYTEALGQGVAHAAGTSFPGEKGNIYLFSHSTDAPWNVIRYNAVFYLLRELEPGDRVVMFYKDRRYDYVVFDKNIVKPTDVTYLTNKYEDSILTLQTCDPPGTLWNRLIVRAKLVGN